jgi:hypothetical protein
MTTYNHERFIAQAIESVLMQRVDFLVELVIGEDCSQDATRQIVCDYQRRYPEKIRLLLWPTNLGGGGMQNGVRTLAACRGEYIAFCEGDDYWTHPEKLQRQVDFLESHPELAMCHHTVEYVRWEDGNRTVLQTFPPESHRKLQQAEDLIGRNFIQTCSLMIRRSCLPELDSGFQRLKLGDWPICYLAAEHGGIGFLNAVMADYRIHLSNSWISLDAGRREFETARMALYLAGVAQPGAQAAWRRFGMELIDSVLANQSTSLRATRRAVDVWRSGCLPFLQVLRLLSGDLAKRLAAELRRFPRVVAVLKRVLRPGR